MMRNRFRGILGLLPLGVMILLAGCTAEPSYRGSEVRYYRSPEPGYYRAYESEY